MCLAYRKMSRSALMLYVIIYLFSNDGTLAAKKAPVQSSCNSTIADLILLVDISNSVWDSLVMDRTFIRNLINGFPIDGKNLRMSLIVFSSLCKTLVPIEKGISREVLFDAVDKPWFPVWMTNLHDCLDQIRTVDLESRIHTSRKIVVVLITDEQPDDMNKAVEAIERLQNQGAKFFMVLTGLFTRSNITEALGAENVIEAIHKAGTDDRMAKKVVSEVCDKTCSTEEKEISGCGWDKQGNCVKSVEIKAYDAKHPACKNFKPGTKSLPCSSEVCKKLCNAYKWGQWDKLCCGSQKGEKIEQTRSRPIPDNLFNQQMCPKSEKFICTVEQPCEDVMKLLKAEEEKVTKSWYIVCICLMILLLVLAMIAFCCLMTSRRRSSERFQRRLKAAGVSMPAAQDMDNLDEQTRNVLADLPMFSVYQASSPAAAAARAGAVTSAAASAAPPKGAKSAAVKGVAAPTPPKKQASKKGASSKSTKKKV